MKYTLWYSNYIDLLNGMGVGSYFIESEDKEIQAGFTFKQETTINELHVMAVRLALKQIPEGADVHIVGQNRYLSNCLHALKKWIETEEIDLKSHSVYWKYIWMLLTKKGKITTEAYVSRKSDPMLWVTSQSSATQFKYIQDLMIENFRYPEHSDWENKATFSKEQFMNWKFEKPYTQIKLEQLIHKRKKEISDKSLPIELGNVIPFRGSKEAI